MPKTSDSSDKFNPKDYSVMFAHKNITLDSINSTYNIPILIMNLKTRKQVFDNPSAVFGYRLEAKYERKQDKKCFGDLSELSSADMDDCLISDNEEFVTINNPFKGGFITRNYGNNPLPWIQIEMNRKLYLSSGYFDYSTLKMKGDRLTELNAKFREVLFHFNEGMAHKFKKSNL